MPSEIYLVKVGMTMTEGIVETWYVPDGGRVEEGQPIYSLETEKVNMDVEAEKSGTVRHLVEAGTTLEPGDVVAWLFEDGETIPEVLPTPKTNPNIGVLNDASEQLASQVNRRSTQRAPAKSGGRVMASPAARRSAKELGVAIEEVVGSGPGGRVTKEDVEEFAQSGGTAGLSKSTTLEPIANMRRVIGKRMFDSLQSTAQLTMTMAVHMDEVIRFRDTLNEELQSKGARLSYTDLVISASSQALSRHPRMNAVLLDNGIQVNEEINVGLAVALDDGLLVPVIRDSNSKSLEDISQEAARLSTLAREGKLGLDDLSGGTFTVSSLGMYGVDTFTPILNPPQTGILGIGRIYAGIEWDGDTPVKTNLMQMSLTWDHRVLDGAPAAEFLADVKLCLESPDQLPH